MMARLQRALARFESSWIGELVAAVSLFVMLFGGLWLGHLMGVQ